VSGGTNLKFENLNPDPRRVISCGHKKNSNFFVRKAVIERERESSMPSTESKSSNGGKCSSLLKSFDSPTEPSISIAKYLVRYVLEKTIRIYLRSFSQR